MRGYALILVAVLACTPQVVGKDPGGQGGSGGSNGGSGGAGGGASAPVATGGAGGFGLPTADAAATSAPDTASAPTACAQSKVGAQLVQVDLLILLDNSSSMRTMAGTRSKWNTAQAALAAFVMDPASAGLGVGLAFFPHSPPTQACNTDADCPADGQCFDNDFCRGGTELSNYECFPAFLPNRCPLGGTCTPGGLCAIGKQPCHQLDAPCSGTPGDTCRRQVRVCSTDAEESCQEADYERPSVPIAALPANQVNLVGAINARAPYGGTPTGVALRGAYQHIRAHLAANPGRRVAVILATDGVPTSCMPRDAGGITADITMAQMGTPSVLTYVIGVFSAEELAMARPTLERFATAGGTRTPYLLDASANLGMQLNQALATIRGQSLPCEFTIPAGTAAIDYGKVNVALDVAGAEQTVPYVESANRCDPMRGGWYYDVPPATGKPTRILVCPASCARFKGASDAKVNLVFGCATQVID